MFLDILKALDDLEVASVKQGKPVTDCVFVFNMTGLGLRHLRGDIMASVTECFTIDEKYYPGTYFFSFKTCDDSSFLVKELVACAMVINAPKIFTILYKLVTPFVDPDTLAKTKIFGADFMDEMLKWMSKEVEKQEQLIQLCLF